ncbi:hypothetical protein PLESTB_001793100 [Pleodorina starrii]|uniref:BTB domain-containing protein n=1 Tax=Pleodorina starrii TaxID=330485 RepID=A0A9W6FAH5_9CHLO|nr:hypothetical protein PLESTB_001793100 [Pleodorina starrii]GLC69175.1 hypothetical protein PLESTF_000798700 [Pleodorina starrii]
MAHQPSFKSSLFGDERYSDCTVTLRVRECGADNYAKRLKTNAGSAALAPADAGSSSSGAAASPTADAGVQEEDLPAHLFLICGGSPFFVDLAEQALAEQAGGGASSGGGKLQLRVLLDTAEDLPYARAALQYIYTGQLAAATSRDVAALLHLWRIASHLQIDGCIAACIAALETRINGDAAAAVSPASPYSGIMELYSCRALLPDPKSNPDAASLLAACRAELTTRVSANGGIAAALRLDALGEMLAWLFPDAPSVMSDWQMQRHALVLPPQLLDALLASDAFATDDEASVLLLVVKWLYANKTATNMTAAVAGSVNSTWAEVLLHRVRLVQMHPMYLYDILNQLFICAAEEVSWLPYILSREEHVLLCQFAADVTVNNSRRRRKLADTVAAAWGRYNCKSPWYNPVPRALAWHDTGIPLEWYISQAVLRRELADQSNTICLHATFRRPGFCLVAGGMIWNPALLFTKRPPFARLMLYSELPEVLEAAGVEDATGVVGLAARLTVHRRSTTGAEVEPLSFVLQKDDYGFRKMSRIFELPLAQVGGGSDSDGDGGDTETGEGSLLAPWAAYLQSNLTISGTVTLL